MVVLNGWMAVGWLLVDACWRWVGHGISLYVTVLEAFKMGLLVRGTSKSWGYRTMREM